MVGSVGTTSAQIRVTVTQNSGAADITVTGMQPVVMGSVVRVTEPITEVGWLGGLTTIGPVPVVVQAGTLTDSGGVGAGLGRVEAGMS